jgi:hypothetical protein
VNARASASTSRSFPRDGAGGAPRSEAPLPSGARSTTTVRYALVLLDALADRASDVRLSGSVTSLRSASTENQVERRAGVAWEPDRRRAVASAASGLDARSESVGRRLPALPRGRTRARRVPPAASGGPPVDSAARPYSGTGVSSTGKRHPDPGGIRCSRCSYRGTVASVRPRSRSAPHGWMLLSAVPGGLEYWVLRSFAGVLTPHPRRASRRSCRRYTAR